MNKNNDFKEEVTFEESEEPDIYLVRSNLIGIIGDIQKDTYDKYFVFYPDSNYYKAFHLYCIFNKLNRLNKYYPKTNKEIEL